MANLTGTAKKRKAVFLDIDGTLIGREHSVVKEDREAMEKAAQDGHFIFLNTGRSFSNIPQALLELTSLKGIAAGGGAHILMNGSGDLRYTTIYRRYISDDRLKKIFAWYGNRSKCCILEGEQGCYYINPSSWFFTVSPPIFVNSYDDFKKISQGDFITKLTLDDFATDDEKQLLESELKLNLFADYAEAIIKSENKAKAMDLILKNLGLSREDSIAIGDGANDLDMIRFAGTGIAMGNACAELKAEAAFITGDCGNGGVAMALHRLLHDSMPLFRRRL